MTKQQVLETGYFQLARSESLKVNFRARVGSVLVRSGKPIAVGKNHPTKTHPMVNRYNVLKTIHAEFDALIGIDRHLIFGSILYVYRETRDGKLANARPCNMCMQLLRDVGIKRVFFTTGVGYDVINHP